MSAQLETPAFVKVTQIQKTINWLQCRPESKLLVFFGFSVCSHVYLLNYRSELAQIWREDTDTIHDHNHTQKKKSMQVQPAIMGRNGRVVLEA